MREYENGSLTGTVLQIILHPRQLVRSERAQAILLDVHHIHETDKVNAVMVKAIPAVALGILSKAFEIVFAIVAGDIIFAGYIKYLLCVFMFLCPSSIGQLCQIAPDRQDG